MNVVWNFATGFRGKKVEDNNFVLNKLLYDQTIITNSELFNRNNYSKII